MGFHVDSEAGRLRRVILHRPDLELKRLTPSNKDALLFDDVLWVRRARARSTTASPTCCATAGVAVHLFGDLLRRGPGRSRRPARSSWTGSSTRRSTARSPPTTCGPPSRRCPPPELAEALVGGMTKREFLERARRADLRPLPRHGPGRLPARPAAQPPLHPRHLRLDLRRRLHQRHALARPAARDRALRGDLPAPPALPRTERTFHVWSEGQADYPSTIEGGDVLVIGNGAVLIGMSERTTPQAVEMLAQQAVRRRVRPGRSWRWTCPSGGPSCTSTR